MNEGPVLQVPMMGVPQVMENYMKKKMEHEMTIGFTWWILRIGVSIHGGPFWGSSHHKSSIVLGSMLGPPLLLIRRIAFEPGTTLWFKCFCLGWT